MGHIERQPIQQIGAETAFRGQAGQIAIGGGHHTHVHPNGGNTAHPIEPTVFDDPKQSVLKRKRHIRHLVQKQRSAVRPFKKTDPGAPEPR